MLGNEKQHQMKTEKDEGRTKCEMNSSHTLREQGETLRVEDPALEPNSPKKEDNVINSRTHEVM